MQYLEKILSHKVNQSSFEMVKVNKGNYHQMTFHTFIELFK